MPDDPLALYIAAPSSVRVIDVSPPSWMVEMILHEKGVSYERHALAFDRGEHRRPEILALNPRGTIPILVSQGQPVSETFAILDYLERTQPAPALLPAPDRPAALARALTRLHETANLKNAGMALFAYLMRTPKDAVDPATLSEHRNGLLGELRRMDDALADGAYLAGDDPTLADFAAHAYVATARYLGLDLSALPRVAAHHERMAARPAIAETRSEAWVDGGRRRLAGVVQ
ncbi:MAG: glutathione S-transferase family protein [Myxococcota bacterium]